ncbi:Protein CBG01118 [Caenorhabditis briggsae]|uniref:Protein CBG01118 n=1 Tax=Caenorhabditis briggsae TaxID=6238 RepID=A8WPL5_CAEBR|nr:Protein CBG01118 [Caenorhabditis briggsae]CAP22422.2 Protein CBG01118 [Caenorhabditis briggsae]
MRVTGDEKMADKVGDSGDGVKRKISNFVFWNQTRVFILALSLTCLTLTQINSQIFTFTVICMDDLIVENQMSNVTEPHWIEGTTEKSILFSATAIGALVGLIPSVPLLNRLGVRLTLSVCGLCSTLGTFFTPIAVSWSFYLVVVCRVLQGLGISVILTVLGVIPTSWSPKSEYSTYLAILSCAWQFSNVIFMPISGILCDSEYGWRSIYYAFGVLTGFFYFIFYMFYTDAPGVHRSMRFGRMDQFPGWKFGIYHTSIIWTNLFERSSEFRCSIHGYINALPYALCAIYKFSAGKISDRIKFASDKTIYTFWLFSSIIGLSIGYCIMAWTTDRNIAFVAFAFAIVTSGLIIMASVKCLAMRCQQHCHFAVSTVSFLSYCVQFISPLGVGIMCPDNTPEQWSRAFLLITGIMILTNAPFPFLTTQEAAEYTKHKKSPMGELSEKV